MDTEQQRLLASFARLKRELQRMGRVPMSETSTYSEEAVFERYEQRIETRLERYARSAKTAKNMRQFNHVMKMMTKHVTRHNLGDEHGTVPTEEAAT